MAKEDTKALTYRASPEIHALIQQVREIDGLSFQVLVTLSVKEYIKNNYPDVMKKDR